jgi:hypothetical protein
MINFIIYLGFIGKLVNVVEHAARARGSLILSSISRKSRASISSTVYILFIHLMIISKFSSS